MDENLAWLTQKTEEPKCNKGKFTFSQHTQWMQLNCKVTKKWQPPISTSTPPFQGYQNFWYPPPPTQVTQLLEGHTPPSLF